AGRSLVWAQVGRSSAAAYSVMGSYLCESVVSVDNHQGASMASLTASQRVEQRYREMTPRSQALFERATGSLPGGNTRTTLYTQPYPCYFDHGAGCKVYDVDGNERIDFINNYTSLILGHGHPRVVEALQRQLLRGVSAAAPTELEVELAEE